MDLEALWDDALKRTEIIRQRLPDLDTFGTTTVPYVFLAESALNPGDTVVRRGQILVGRPSLILPGPQLDGFQFEQDLHFSEDAVLNFLLVRGVRFPSLRYHHELSSLDVREGSLQEAVRAYQAQLAQAEDVSTGLIIGPEDAWQFSVLILVGRVVIRSAEGDLKRLFEEWRKRHRDT